MVLDAVEKVRRSIGVAENDAAELEHAAAKLLRAFKPVVNGQSTDSERWQPDRAVAFALSEEDIVGPFVVETPDQNTFSTVALQVALKSGRYALDKAGCELLEQLAERWSLNARFRDLSTPASMRERLKRWCFQILESEQFCSSVNFVVASLKEDIDLHEVWVGLADIDVEDCVPMGKIEIRGITREQIETWIQAQVRNGLPEESVASIRAQLQNEWQGHTAAVYSAIGDNSAVQAAAVEYAERACALIRLVEPGNQSATQRSYLQPQTFLAQAGSRTMLIDPMDSKPSALHGLVSNPPCGIRITRASFPKQWEEGLLRNLHELLSADPRSPFQDWLLRAVLIFSRQRLSTEAIEKLIFVISALETMFFAGDRNAGRKVFKRRFSAALAGSEEYRKHICDVVDNANRLRDGFLHHGRSADDRRAIELFLKNAWLFFWLLIPHHERWHDINDYCQELDSAYDSRFGNIAAEKN